jgi:hypothetical protein
MKQMAVFGGKLFSSISDLNGLLLCAGNRYFSHGGGHGGEVVRNFLEQIDGAFYHGKNQQPGKKSNP